PNATADALGAAEDAPAVDKGDLFRHPYRHHRHHQLLPGLCHKGLPY
ncbi:hypothetical protein Tco_0376195, partial [Tanacetum coccineum]